ncbi:MAG: FG-GAP-like repeat-containing protein [Limisphaerales bacterium]
MNQILLNGSGVAAGDVDGDGWCDLYFCGLDGPNALYRNLGGWRFEEVAAASGVDCPALDSTGALLADLDGDTNLDLVVNSVAGGTHVFLNDGRGRFNRVAVINEGRGGMSLAAADFDGDGDLDLYLCNYRTVTLRDQPGTNFRITSRDGIPTVAAVNGLPANRPELEGRFSVNALGRISEHGEADAVFRNEGRGRFTQVPFTGGAFLDEAGVPLARPPHDWSLSVMCRDLNADGLPDIYVCGDFDSPDRIWLNAGGGRFRAAPPLAFRNTSKFSMGLDVADINRDGLDDLLVLDMLSREHVVRLTRADKGMDNAAPGDLLARPQLGRNTLHLNRGDGTYSEIACYAGLAATEWSWAPVFLDVDLDGFEDLLVTTGHGRDDMDLDTGLRLERTRRSRSMPPAEELALRKASPALPRPNLAFRNLGDLRFEETGARWGFDQAGISHGIALADLDNDGDMDVAVNNLNAAAGLHRNDGGAPRVAVRLRGAGGNPQGIGSRITLLNGAVPRQAQEIVAGGRYLSGDEALRTFAAGPHDALVIEVAWRSGRTSRVEGVRANHAYELREPSGGPATPPAPPAAAATLFAESSAFLPHTHGETPFDDFSRQPLLPNRLSQLGPGLGWIDLDGDGRDELVIGAGVGESPGVFTVGRGGEFVRRTDPAFAAPAPAEHTSVLGLPRADGGMQLLAGFSGYEAAGEPPAPVQVYDPATAGSVPVAPPMPASPGPLALGDVDGDGRLELFVGSRVLPGRYPESGGSLVLRQEDGRFQPDPRLSAPLQSAGMVSGAVWTDLTGDGLPELVLACEWGPLRIFSNDRGQLREATREWGLHEFTGWWNGVAAGDFDGDGRLDLAASNWGLNTKYQASRQHPRRLHYGDFNGVGAVDVIEAAWAPELAKWVPERDFNQVGRALPWVRDRFATHRAFAEASLAEVLGDRLAAGAVLEAVALETAVFLNRGVRFERGRLPPAAQFSPAFGINVLDADGDGAEDLFLSQNFFAVQPQTSRSDAGRGLLLKGDGRGAFTEFPASGIHVAGEQRGSAVGDYDHDGRVDLVVAQNGAATRLYRNQGARPGLRVALRGPAGNPAGAGAKVRLRFASGWGPVREIRAGGGYWSQDSLTPVLATPTPADQVEVQWPGGRIVRTAPPPGAPAIAVTLDGRVLAIP